MKNIFLNFCYIANILLVIITIMLAVSYSFNIDAIYNLIFSDIGVAIRGILVVLSMLLWIHCIIIWSKFDKNMSHLLLIFLLSGIYVIFYFRRIKKEAWG